MPPLFFLMTEEEWQWLGGGLNLSPRAWGEGAEGPGIPHAYASYWDPEVPLNPPLHQALHPHLIPDEANLPSCAPVVEPLGGALGHPAPPPPPQHMVVGSSPICVKRAARDPRLTSCRAVIRFSASVAAARSVHCRGAFRPEVKLAFSCPRKRVLALLSFIFFLSYSLCLSLVSTCL